MVVLNSNSTNILTMVWLLFHFFKLFLYLLICYEIFLAVSIYSVPSTDSYRSSSLPAVVLMGIAVCLGPPLLLQWKRWLFTVSLAFFLAITLTYYFKILTRKTGGLPIYLLFEFHINANRRPPHAFFDVWFL